MAEKRRRDNKRGERGGMTLEAEREASTESLPRKGKMERDDDQPVVFLIQPIAHRDLTLDTSHIITHFRQGVPSR